MQTVALAIKQSRRAGLGVSRRQGMNGTPGRLMAEPARSYAGLARTIERIQPTARLVTYPRYVQSLPFYCRRRVIVVGAKTELAFGSEHVRDAAQYFFSGRDDLLKLWNDPRSTVFVVDRATLEHFRQVVGSYQVIASDLKKVVVMHPDIAPLGQHIPGHALK
jgi:hypothetical protein